MSVQNLLENFAKAKDRIKRDIEENSAVFKRHEQLVGDLIDAENALRDAVAEEVQNNTELKVGVETKVAEADGFKVFVTKQEQLVYDDEKLALILPKEQLDQVAKKYQRPPRINIREN